MAKHNVRIRSLAFLLTTALLGAHTISRAAINSGVAYTLYTDGTAGFDPSAGPGFDTNANNGIVRTNDTLTYRVSFSTTGSESGITITETLPLEAATLADGSINPRANKPIAKWTALPAYCITGSSISTDGQTIICKLTTISSAGTTNIDLTATVLSTVANGTAIPAPTLTMTSVSGTAPAATTTPATATVSAAPFYDIVVKNSYIGNPKAYGYMGGGGPGNADGVYERPLVGLVAHNPNGYGNKGVEQLTGPITINIDLSGMPTGTLLDTWHNGNATDGTPAATGSFVDGCGNPLTGGPSLESGGNINMASFVTDSGVAATSTNKMNTVPNGGDCVATSSGPQGIVTMTISGADSSLTNQPTEVVSTKSPVPTTDWWIFNKALVLWTPITSYPDNVAVTNTVKLASFTGTSISGQAMKNVNVDTTNYGDNFSYPFTNQPNGAASKVFTSDTSLAAPYNTLKDPAIPSDDHVNYMTPGQTVRSRVVLQDNGTTDYKNVTSCEVIDRTVFDIGTKFGAATSFVGNASALASTVEYGVRAAGKYFATTDSANVNPNLTVLNAPGTTSAYSQATCNDAGITWYSTAAAAEAAGGIVYVRATYPSIPSGTTSYLYVQGLILRSTYAATISTIYPSAVTHTAGDAVADGTLIRNVARIGNSGITTPTGIKLDNTIYNDHLQVVTMKTVSRVTKSVAVVDGKVPTSSPAPALPGSTVTYSLIPRYSTTFPPTARTFTVTDILPPGLSYVSGSATTGGAAGEPQVFANDPATGYTRLVWTYQNRAPYLGNDGATGSLLPEIRFNANVAPTVSNNSVLSNAVAVSGGGAAAGTTDDYDADCAYSTTTAFGSCVKSSTAGIQVQTTPGFRIQKTTPTTVIEPGQAFSFNVSYASFGQTMYATDIPDVIDILPFATDGTTNTPKHFTGRSPSSSFVNGAYQLTGVIVPSNDSNMTVYYTSTAPASVDNDPRDPSNLSGGTTKWCLITDFGSAGCPTSLAQVTAVRLHPGVTSMPSDALYSTTFNMVSTSTAKAGDMFNNSVGAHSLDPASTLQFVEAQAQSPVKVVMGSIAGQVYMDINQNGVLESGSDAAIAGVCMTLTGTTSSGATITASTRTKADGTYSFSSGATNIYATADCSGTALGSFGGLLSGTYAVTEQQPTGYNDGKDYAGTLGGTLANDTVTAIPLTAGQSGTGYTFTEMPLPLTFKKSVDTPYIKIAPTTNASGTPVSYTPASQQMTYTLAVTNPGAGSISNVVLTDSLPAGLTFVKATLDGAALAPSSTSPLTLTLPAAIPGNTTKNVLVTVSFASVTPNTNLSTIKNTATMTVPGQSAINSDAFTEYVYPRLFKQVHNLGQNPGATIPQAAPAWTDKSTGLPGDTLEYCIDFYNYGTTPQNNYTLTDNVPANTKVVDGSWIVKQGTMQSLSGDFPPPATVNLVSNTVTASGMVLSAASSGTMCFRAVIK